MGKSEEGRKEEDISFLPFDSKKVVDERIMLVLSITILL